MLDSERCPIYSGSLLSNVKIAPSPYEIRKRLLAFRVRPVNNVVDCANMIYILLPAASSYLRHRQAYGTSY